MTMVEMAGYPPCSAEDVALVKVGDVFDGWNGGLIKGEPDFSVSITSVNNFTNIVEGMCYADIDCQITFQKKPFIGQTRMLSSIKPYRLALIKLPTGLTLIQLETKLPPKRNAPVEKSSANKPQIDETITLQKAPAARGAAAARGAGGSGKRKNRRGTKRVRRTRRRSSRRH